MEEESFEDFVRRTLGQILDRLGNVENRLDNLENNMRSGFKGINDRLDDIENQFA